MNNRESLDKGKLYDVIVIGGGPAGLSAALYLARAKYRVLVLEKEQFGGQITITHEVVNYPGVKRTSGKELTETMQRQAESFGAEFLLAEATGLDADGDVKKVITDKGDFYCFGILIATGAHPRSVGFKGEAEHKGRGVAYCATCDGEFFTGKEIFVIGGGYAAAEESVFLTKFAKHVTILIRGDDFSCAASVAETARKNDKISVITNTTVEEVSGDTGLNYIRYKNTKTGDTTEYRTESGETFGVFVFAGYAPEAGLVKDIAALDEKGYIITDKSQKTDIDGIYAAGDVCIKPLRQVVTATSDGALAATELEKYAAEMQRKTGLYPTPPIDKTHEGAKSEPKMPSSDSTDGLFSADIKSQLSSVFEKMEQRVKLMLYLDKRDISKELEGFIREFSSLSDKLSVDVADADAPSDTAPCVKICRENGEQTGLAFHGVPGGHEFTSFVLGIYNASGSGQTVDEETGEAVSKINLPVNIKVMVSLSCTMCPDTVAAAQYIAAKNENVTADIYDVHHFPALKEQYNVMSVPCIVINDSAVSFGKKNIKQIIQLIDK